MSAVKISQLPSGSELQNADLIPISRGTDNFSIQGSRIATTTQLQSVSSTLTTNVQNVSATLTTYFNSISSSNVNAVKRVFTGTGSQTTFNLGLTQPSTNVNGYRVDIDGVIQEPGVDYLVSNGNIQFTTAPSLNNKIVVVTAEVLSTVSLSSNVVTDNLTTNNLTVLSGINIIPIKRSFVGNGTQTSFALTGFTPSANANSYRIDIDGILQEPGEAYIISGGNLVFSAAPGNNTKITVITADILSPTQGAVSFLNVNERSGNFTLTDFDSNKIFHCNTTATPVLSVSFPSNLSNGFNVGLYNVGTGTIAISSTQTPSVCAVGVRNTTRFTGVTIYKFNNTLFGIGVFN